MQLPANMPGELGFLSAVEGQQQLLDVLQVCSPEQLISFLQATAEDESWCDAHLPLLSALVLRLSHLFLSNQVSQALLGKFVAVVAQHARVWRPLLPNDLILDVLGKRYEGSSLLYGQASTYFSEQLLARDALEQSKIEMEVNPVSIHVFEQIAEYVKTQSGRHLTTLSLDELLQLLIQAVEWGMPDLRAACIHTLRHLIDPEVAVKLLATSQYYHLADLRAACCQRWNDYVTGFSLESIAEGELAVVIRQYHAREIPLLESIVPLVTRYALRDSAALEPLAVTLLQQTGRLRALDLSETVGCLPALFEAAPDIIELRLAGCLWLEEETLLNLIEQFPHLRRLDLAGNTNPTDAVWRRLKEQQQLEGLVLAHCHQLTGEDLEMILGQIGSGLRELDLSWCISLSEQSLHHALRGCLHLTHLDVSHCPEVGDRLVKDLAANGTLQAVHLAGCMAISDEPVRQLALNAPALRLLDVRFCRLSAGVIAGIRHLRPQLTLVH